MCQTDSFLAVLRDAPFNPTQRWFMLQLLDLLQRRGQGGWLDWTDKMIGCAIGKSARYVANLREIACRADVDILRQGPQGIAPSERALGYSESEDARRKRQERTVSKPFLAPDKNRTESGQKPDKTADMSSCARVDSDSRLDLDKNDDDLDSDSSIKKSKSESSSQSESNLTRAQTKPTAAEEPAEPAFLKQIRADKEGWTEEEIALAKRRFANHAAKNPISYPLAYFRKTLASVRDELTGAQQAMTMIGMVKAEDTAAALAQQEAAEREKESRLAKMRADIARFKERQGESSNVPTAATA